MSIYTFELNDKVYDHRFYRVYFIGDDSCNYIEIINSCKAIKRGDTIYLICPPADIAQEIAESKETKFRILHPATDMSARMGLHSKFVPEFRKMFPANYREDEWKAFTAQPSIGVKELYDILMTDAVTDNPHVIAFSAALNRIGYKNIYEKISWIYRIIEEFVRVSGCMCPEEFRSKFDKCFGHAKITEILEMTGCSF